MCAWSRRVYFSSFVLKFRCFSCTVCDYLSDVHFSDLVTLRSRRTARAQ